ncbi:MAG TPA: hypothetical protein G4N92_00455 [Anaerolineae bacterium]|nr:hypothetical protein [Anaerolineae bacterium]
MKKWILFHKIKTGIIIFSVVLLTILSSTVVTASSDELDFVYGTNHFNGAAYSSALIPHNIDTFYLLADETNIITARHTSVYYWPITNEYKADWESANIVVEGTLEILKHNELVESIDLTEYVIQYDNLNKYETIQLYLGEDSIIARQNFEYMITKYRDDLYDYNIALNTYREEFQDALAELQAGNITEDELPERPLPLADLTLFSTNLLIGFPVTLPVGEYNIRLRLPDKSVQKDSEKKLVVFDSIQDGASYNILTQDRWTVPEISEDNNETIYTIKGNTFFMQLYHQKQYNELYYMRMNNPQDKTARADRKVWVPFSPVKNMVLEVYDQQRSFTVTRGDYFVHQLIGSKLGYEIVDFDPETMNRPSFDGYKIVVDGSSSVYRVIAKDTQNNALPGSEREIRVLYIDRSWMIYCVSLIPLTIGLLVVLLRRKKIRDIKVIG